MSLSFPALVPSYLLPTNQPFENLCLMANNNALVTEEFDSKIKKLNHAINKLIIAEIALIASTIFFVFAAVLGSFPAAIAGAVIIGMNAVSNVFKTRYMQAFIKCKNAETELKNMYDGMGTYLDAKKKEMIQHTMQFKLDKLDKLRKVDKVGTKHQEIKKTVHIDEQLVAFVALSEKLGSIVDSIKYPRSPECDWFLFKISYPDKVPLPLKIKITLCAERSKSFQKHRPQDDKTLDT